MIQFWFLWVFITLVVVIVALTPEERKRGDAKERNTTSGGDKCQ